MNENWTTFPDGSMTTDKWERQADERTKVLTEALFEIQRRMPAGQNWNLHSHGGCRQIAEHLNDTLNEWEN